MMTFLRNAANTWVAKLLLVILVVSFAVWGISGEIHSGFGSRDVVTAGRTGVSGADFRLAYDRQLSLLSQQFGQRITREQAKSMGIEDQVIGQLAAGAVLDEQARKMGLGLSRDRLAQLTFDDPAFRGQDGRFDRRVFDYVLNQIGMRPDDYLRNRAQVAVRQQIVQAVADGVAMPDVFFKAVALYRGEDRTAEYLVLPRSLVEPVEEPSETVLEEYFEANKATYRAPEYRSLSYVRLRPEDIVDASAITDAQVKDDYEKNAARYTTPETRTIEQIVFSSKEAADTASASLKGGATFEQVAKAQGKSEQDIRLGAMTKEQIADPAVAEAAFSLAEGQVSDVVSGSFGPVLLRVTEIKPQTVKSLQDVAEDIRRELALVEANKVLPEVLDSYEDARAGGSTLREAAEKLKLKVMTVDAIDRDGTRPDGSVVGDLPDSQQLISRAFDSEEGTENDPLDAGNNGYVLYEVNKITPARDRELDEVKDKVVADWKAAEADKRLKAKADELEKRLQDGATLDTIASELGLEKQTKRGLKRGGDDADFGSDGVRAIFSVAENGVGQAATPDKNGTILFKVTEAFEPAGAGPDAVPEQDRKSLSSALSDDLLDQLVAQLQTQFQVRVNRSVASQALAY